MSTDGTPILGDMRIRMPGNVENGRAEPAGFVTGPSPIQ
jgi:hypothetical protein